MPDPIAALADDHTAGGGVPETSQNVRGVRGERDLGSAIADRRLDDGPGYPPPPVGRR